MVTVLSLGVMALIVVGLVIGAWRERRRHRHMAAIQGQLPVYPSHPLQNPPALVPYISNSLESNKQLSAQSSFHLPSSWYTRWRTLVSLGFLFMAVLALFVQTGVADSTLHQLGESLNLFGNDVSGVEVHTAVQTIPLNTNASQRLVRISQLDPAQYSSTSEYNLWAYSACSAASMTEVFNAYGDHLRITDVLKVESQIGEITPSQGLLKPQGIANTAAQFGFKTNWGNSWSLDAVINTANSGHPVIVSFPPDRYAGGHLLVVIGGNSSSVYLADTSLWNRSVLSRGQFLQWWEGFAAVVMPK
jgi:hypothetical protein